MRALTPTVRPSRARRTPTAQSDRLAGPNGLVARGVGPSDPWEPADNVRNVSETWRRRPYAGVRAPGARDDIVRA
ncbi:hypothetical protein GCM10017691_49770 [Pseudonocardia petroleophila]